ncbi:hypothetical protein [Okeania sp. SIO3B5]|uniref:hypothetical protein n=1 Tax=Okeania sp. SIO3B5 TaxID=2607811 RepID=UPI0025F748E3|nr:hypothetical protein [Okeania sp. SIO3B5]
MISGIVNNGYPTVSITFRLPDRPDFSIQFVVDTGFTDELCLPSEVVALLYHVRIISDEKTYQECLNSKSFYFSYSPTPHSPAPLLF